jgi:NADH dehydrogenase
MILVTGATGFVGRRVVRALASGGHAVRALVHTESSARVLPARDVELARGDVLDPQSLRRACEGVDSIIHLVAIVREVGSRTFRRVNHEGTRDLLEAATAAGVTRFIHASTLGAGSDPAIPYLYSRWMAEQEVARSPLA